MNELWRFELLGHLRVSSQGRAIERFRTRKEASLLAFLAFHPRSHTRESLIDLLWPDIPLDAGRNNLSVTLSGLRRTLHQAAAKLSDANIAETHMAETRMAEAHIVEAHIVEANIANTGIEYSKRVAGETSLLCTTRDSVQLQTAFFTTDVGDFHRALQHASCTDDAAEQTRALETAVALYRGALLPHLDEEWIAPAARHLQEQFFDALQKLVQQSEKSGDLACAIALAQQGVANDSLRESLHQALMRLHTARGHGALALQQFDYLKRALKKQLDAQPDELSHQLARAARRSKACLEENRAPTRSTEIVASENSVPVAIAPPPALPMQWTRFFGRETEIAHLTKTLQQRGVLVTIVGPGGNGKSRLAIEAARRLTERQNGRLEAAPRDIEYSKSHLNDEAVPRNERAIFVACSGLSESSYLLRAVTDALSLQILPHHREIEEVLEALAARPTLLIFDTFEHVLPHGRELVQTLLSRVPTLSVLVTSRRTLGLADEHQMPLAPLPTPQHTDTDDMAALTQIPSVQLFLDRAQMADVHFALTRHNAASVAEICRKLAGLPLAIELAASRVRVLSPSEIVAKIGLGHNVLRLETPVGEARHHSLRAAFDWSFELLRPDLQRAFVSLWPLRGVWTSEAAAFLCDSDHDSSLDDLQELCDYSLLQTRRCEEVTGFRWLDPLREYARERCDDALRLEVERRHFTFFARMAAEAAPHWHGPQSPYWLRKLGEAQDNVRAALKWALQHEPQKALQNAVHLASFWEMSGQLQDGCDQLEKALAGAPDAPPSLRCDALNAAGHLNFFMGKPALTTQQCAESLRLSREIRYSKGEADALLQMGIMERFRGEDALAESLIGRSLPIFRALNDQIGAANALLFGGICDMAQIRIASSLAAMHESLEIWRALQSPNNIALCLFYLSHAAHYKDMSESLRYLEEGEAVARAGGDQVITAYFFWQRGNWARAQGDWAQALARYITATRMLYAMKHVWAATFCVESLTFLNAALGQPRRAAVLLGATKSLRELIGYPRALVYRAEHDACRCALQAALPDFDELWQQGTQMTWQQTLGFALQTPDFVVLPAIEYSIADESQ